MYYSTVDLAAGTVKRWSWPLLFIRMYQVVCDINRDYWWHCVWHDHWYPGPQLLKQIPSPHLFLNIIRGRCLLRWAETYRDVLRWSTSINTPRWTQPRNPEIKKMIFGVNISKRVSTKYVLKMRFSTHKSQCLGNGAKQIQCKLYPVDAEH